MKSKIQTHLVNGLELQLAIFCIKVHLFITALLYLKSVRQTIYVVRILRQQIKKYRGPKSIQKIAKVNGVYYWDMYGAGWPSAGFTRNIQRECRRAIANPSEHVGMRNVLVAITTKCPLQCEHCFEWTNLNVKERLSYTDLQTIIEKLIRYGVGQIHLSGGEPMMRYPEVLKLVEHYHHQVGFWLITSGYQLTENKAQALKQAGLMGVSISLDYVEDTKHDQFRHYAGSFDAAKNAAVFSNQAGLVTTFTLCATKEFLNESNLMHYANFARQCGVVFIQLLEPRAVGHYENMPVQLQPAHRELLREFFLNFNSQSQYKDFPAIIYHEYYRETLGCRGGGNGAFYIDPLGIVHACPFCRKNAGNIVTMPVEDCVNNLRMGGCFTTTDRSAASIADKMPIMS